MRAASVPAAGLTALALLALVLIVPSHGAVPNDPQNKWADIGGIAVGDYWEYEVSGQEDGTVRNTVMEIERKKTYFGDRYDSFRVRASGTLQSEQQPTSDPIFDRNQGPEVRADIEIDKWTRVSDYATVHLDGNATFEDGVTAHSIQSFDPAFIETIFPFGEGYQWHTNAKTYQKRGEESPETFSFTARAHVQAVEQVTVPAGTFRAWRVHYTEGVHPEQTYIQWYAEEACEIIKEERYDNNNELVNSMVLSKYRCSHVEKPNPTYTDGSVRLISTGKVGPPPGGLDVPTGSPTNGETNGSPAPTMVVAALVLVAAAAFGRRPQ